MQTSFRLSALSSLLLLSSSVMAADVAIITLENGAQVRLKDDFTWEYIITETKAAEMPVAVAAAPSTNIVNTNTAAVAVAPVTTLTANAIARPELLGSTAKDGIKVSFTDSQWKGNKLGLTFELASTSGEHVTLVEVETSFFADDGSLLKTEKLGVWKAIFRMPETYLRKGEQRKSRVIWIEGVDKNRWQKQLLNLKITEIESR
ncbi:DUF3157 family protein [Shewanella oneidensis MR-1]|uniref:DUF3157 domain-containing protein n=1 Tax=Shewanella oneidensis (strain ATCC 700550 / JCM 31522 / CIP 106686 / LMG 19005 / NCIMB 14063 / MR-1) TaxID=211586 RepID=Q8EKH9_SHEON|nr:DUF3157 family protein [Shewanella oneidensis]AAN53201.1 periplasmic protein of unknown function DUF3157 [Shewanella oneidensis MR-1]MDX5997904.1 DUF3157 family protein [Shewanella oneidensis]MEE2026948.1 hypothetical protein [Shewanella oneidensis]QKG95088.1 DUF3157 family protein [Shewanella oneidensis MR-1]